MSFEKAKADLEEKGLGDHVIVLNESSATVAEAAHALGVEPASIAKTLSVLQGEKAGAQLQLGPHPSGGSGHPAPCHQRHAA